MCGRILPEVLKLASHFRADDVSPMAEVLKGLDEDHSCSFYSLHEYISPIVFSALEEGKRKEEDRWRKDNQQMKKSDDMNEGPPNSLPDGSFRY